MSYLMTDFAGLLAFFGFVALGGIIASMVDNLR